MFTENDWREKELSFEEVKAKYPHISPFAIIFLGNL